ncbi:MAG: ABC transporter ATP-binding protein [Lachnospiraceae bacterium]|nr:ABC transporter ATP-binding protein [Lachnospiraceae bacterium]
MDEARSERHFGGDLNARAGIVEESYAKHKGHPLLTLTGIFRGYYHNFVLSAFFYIIKHSPVWVLPIATANIINEVTDGTPLAATHINLYGLMLAALFILNVPMNHLHQHFRSAAIRSAEAGLRSALVHKIQKLTIPYYRQIQSGRLQSKIIRDVEAVEGVSTQLFVGALNVGINLAVALAVTVTRSRIVFLVFLFMAPVAALLMWGFRKPIGLRNRSFRKELENTGAVVNEMVQLLPVTRAHALEEEEMRRMDVHLHHVAKEGYGLDLIQADFGAVSWGLFQLFQVLCLVFTAHLASRGTIPAGDVVLYQSYFTTLVAQVSAIMNLLPTIARGLESVNSIGEVLLSDEVEDTAGGTAIEAPQGSFDFRDVTYRYPGTDKDVLQDLTLHIPAGTRVAFVGESGAGKSTLINMVIGFLVPEKGQVLLDGQDLATVDLHSYRKHLAVVPQETILFSGTIRENILYGTKDVSEETLQRVIEESGLRNVLVRLPDGLETKVGEHGNLLSGGQKQRIAIARALIRDPRVIILDEATSALDAISEQEVTEALDGVCAGRTTFVVAHKLKTVESADLIVVLQDGRVVESGTPAELVAKKGYYAELRGMGG